MTSLMMAALVFILEYHFSFDGRVRVKVRISVLFGRLCRECAFYSQTIFLFVGEEMKSRGEKKAIICALSLFD